MVCDENVRLRRNSRQQTIRGGSLQSNNLTDTHERQNLMKIFCYFSNVLKVKITEILITGHRLDNIIVCRQFMVTDEIDSKRGL